MDDGTVNIVHGSRGGSSRGGGFFSGGFGGGGGRSKRKRRLKRIRAYEAQQRQQAQAARERLAREQAVAAQQVFIATQSELYASTLQRLDLADRQARQQLATQLDGEVADVALTVRGSFTVPGAIEFSREKNAVEQLLANKRGELSVQRQRANGFFPGDPLQRSLQQYLERLQQAGAARDYLQWASAYTAALDAQRLETAIAQLSEPRKR